MAEDRRLSDDPGRLFLARLTPESLVFEANNDPAEPMAVIDLPLMITIHA